MDLQSHPVVSIPLSLKKKSILQIFHDIVFLFLTSSSENLVKNLLILNAGVLSKAVQTHQQAV